MNKKNIKEKKEIKKTKEMVILSQEIEELIEKSKKELKSVTVKTFS